MVQPELQIPEDFLKEEVRCGYTVSAQMKEVWAMELDLLYKMQQICKKYDIEYFADGGTLLGCARHKGFIPWDDDIDIAMTRDNYKKFCKVAKKELKEPYFLQNEETVPWQNVGGYTQICNSLTTAIYKNTLHRNFKYNQGIRIDIFPQDKVPEDSEEQKIFFARLSGLRKKAHTTRNRLHNDKGEHNYIKSILHFLAKTLHIKNSAYSRFEKECQKFNTQDAKYMGSISYVPAREIGLREVKLYKDVIELPFEFLKLPCPRNYDQYLTDFYGDWQVAHKGKSLHEGETIFDTNISYKQYLKDLNRRN